MIGKFIRNYPGFVGFFPENLCKTGFDMSTADCTRMFTPDPVLNTLTQRRINVIWIFGVVLC